MCFAVLLHVLEESEGEVKSIRPENDKGEKIGKKRKRNQVVMSSNPIPSRPIPPSKPGCARVCLCKFPTLPNRVLKKCPSGIARQPKKRSTRKKLPNAQVIIYPSIPFVVSQSSQSCRQKRAPRKPSKKSGGMGWFSRPQLFFPLTTGRTGRPPRCCWPSSCARSRETRPPDTAGRAPPPWARAVSWRPQAGS